MPDYPLTWHRASKTRKPRRTTPEGAVFKAVTAYLRLCKLGTVWRQSVGVAHHGEHGERTVPYGELGASDLRLDLHGDPRSVYIEVKAPNGRLSPHQDAYLERQKARGHFAVVVRSVEELYEFLTRVGFKVPRPGARRAA